jgi:ppGpp synthetase/RelA/SpoT-type nucleotidyltranferase
MASSKSQVDKAGKYLSRSSELTIERIQMDQVFDEYRASHLEPLSRITNELQQWMRGYGRRYYIAQRLKRRPQVLRKLIRFKSRLTQLQDIGGCRIIVDKNTDVDAVYSLLKEKHKQKSFRIDKATDYRAKGKDTSGYRSLHLILECDERAIELQIRSRIQHYWAEAIERTSVVYGHFLKELDGDPVVIDYFKLLSDALFEIENKRDLSTKQKLDLETARQAAEAKIYESDTHKVFDMHVNEDVVRTLASAQIHGDGLNNWIIVFNWREGGFVTWEAVGFEPKLAAEAYSRYEEQFSAEDGFEVVMIGASDIATVRQTHSHYFGIEKFATILETIDESIAGLKTKMDIDVGARQILAVLFRKKYWGKNTISISTLKNHFVQKVVTFDSSLSTLHELGLIEMRSADGPISLNLKKKTEIQGYL